jgi:hypothetical protein
MQLVPVEAAERRVLPHGMDGPASHQRNRSSGLPCLVSAPRCCRSPLEYSLGISPTATVTNCGRVCFKNRKVNLSQVFAGQNVGVKQVNDRVWLVTFMQYDLGYFDDETCRLTGTRALRATDAATARQTGPSWSTRRSCAWWTGIPWAHESACPMLVVAEAHPRAHWPQRWRWRNWLAPLTSYLAGSR